MLRYKEVKAMLESMLSGMRRGQRLPGRIALTKLLDSSRATIDKALRELEAEGKVESRLGSGTFASGGLNGVVSDSENWCLVVPDIGERIYAQLASGVERYAKKRNAHVILCSSERSAQKQAEYIDRLIHAGVAGFIIVPVVTLRVTESLELYQSLEKSRIPFVFCNRDVEGVTAPVIKSNDFYGGYKATLHLIDQGYRHIAFLSRQRYRTSIDRCQGYISALQHRGLPIERRHILMPLDASIEACCDALEKMLDSNPSIDAVFCFNDVIALAAMERIKKMGKAIPEEIGIIGYDDLEEGALAHPALTSVSYKTLDIGCMAAQVLGKMIDGEAPRGFDYYLMEPEIHQRESCIGKRD